MQGLSFFKVSVWRERGSFYIGNSWRSFLFFSPGICHGFCYCLFESTWAELRGGVFLLFISEMVQALAHVVLEEKKKNPPSAGLRTFSDSSGFLLNMAKLPRFTQRKAGFQHSVLITAFSCTAQV